MNEKRKPSYDLVAFKRFAASPERFATTKTALVSAIRLGFTKDDIAKVIQSMERSQFQKSMTSYSDHRVWQDVYHVPSPAGVLYVKFTADVVTEFLLLSFKEKDDG